MSTLRSIIISESNLSDIPLTDPGPGGCWAFSRTSSLASFYTRASKYISKPSDGGAPLHDPPFRVSWEIDHTSVGGSGALGRNYRLPSRLRPSFRFSERFNQDVHEKECTIQISLNALSCSKERTSSSRGMN